MLWYSLDSWVPTKYVFVEKSEKYQHFWLKLKIKLELVFVKHYAPNCLTLTLLDSNIACPWR